MAIGIALDTLYSQRVGLLDGEAARGVAGLLADLGFQLDDPALAQLDIGAALAAFREHLGGQLCITLLATIGRGVEVHAIDVALMQACVATLLAPTHSPVLQLPC